MAFVGAVWKLLKTESPSICGSRKGPSTYTIVGVYGRTALTREPRRLSILKSGSLVDSFLVSLSEDVPRGCSFRGCSSPRGSS